MAATEGACDLGTSVLNSVCPHLPNCDICETKVREAGGVMNGLLKQHNHGKQRVFKLT